MNQSELDELDLIIERHRKWLNGEGDDCRADLSGADLSGADLSGANLSGANLYGADLRGANLYGADLDFSCYPLWCGGLKWGIDKRLACQIAYHFCSMDCEDAEVRIAQNALLELANQFHRVGVKRLVKRK